MNSLRPIWYAKSQFIRKKRNHSWSEDELKKIFSLRVQRVPVDLIIQKLRLDVKRTQIYNVLRMMKKSRKGRCIQCNQLLTVAELAEQEKNKFKVCAKCREENHGYKKRKRDENSEKGLCACCGTRPPLKGKKTCLLCLSYTHRRRIANGLCGACGKRPLSKNSIALCNVCLGVNNINTSIHRKELSHAKG